MDHLQSSLTSPRFPPALLGFQVISSLISILANRAWTQCLCGRPGCVAGFQYCKRITRGQRLVLPLPKSDSQPPLPHLLSFPCQTDTNKCLLLVLMSSHFAAPSVSIFHSVSCLLSPLHFMWSSSWMARWKLSRNGCQWRQCCFYIFWKNFSLDKSIFA